MRNDILKGVFLVALGATGGFKTLTQQGQLLI